jgi:FRG domain
MPLFTSLSALQDALQALPSCPPGKTRIFRGQTTDYPTITPASYRNHLEFDGIWRFYSRFLLMDITNENFNTHLGDKEFQILGLWLEAVAQHYASGSRYLDVTHSIESAAWFALHRGTWITERGVLGPPGPPSPFDLPSEEKWLQYNRAEAPGYLYAFDVDSWDGASAIPPDLALIDLSRAPEPFRTPRMLAQMGCLIKAGNATAQDLRQLRVDGTPLQIAWPMTGSFVVQREVEEMFPLPTVDDWYRRFLSVPMMPEVNAVSGEVVLKRPLPVTLYRGKTPDYNATVSDTEVFLYPPLLHRLLRQPETKPEMPATNWWQEFSILDATPIVLEAPLLHAFSPAESDNWNHELLLEDISDTVATYSLASKKSCGDTSLLNVLVQFSQLEEVFWEHAATAADTIELRRGLWIRRHNGELVVQLLCQDFPGTVVKGWAPVVIRLDPEKCRMIFKPIDGSMDWVDLASLPVLAKPVFIALYLLRALSPALKPEAMSALFSLSQQNSGGAEYTYLVSVFADVARLIRVPDPAGAADWFVLRNDQGEPYTQAINGSVIKVQDPKPYGDVAASKIRDAMLAAGLTSEKS